MNILKTTSLIILFILMGQGSALAHYLWIETAPTGKQGKAHQVNVYFGEYTYGLIEDPNGDHFEGVKNFEVWAITPSGERISVPTKITKDGYSGSFIPKEKGTYTVALNNDSIDVIDYTKYDFGIFKTHYHSTAKVVIGKEIAASTPTNPEGLNVLNLSEKIPTKDGNASFQVLYQGKPMADAEVSIFMKNKWSKEMKTDAKGKFSFELPWKEKYILEITTKEEAPGKYMDENYEFIWHCATYCINL